ncbi:unnamed protein product, partial [Sphagnum balticum]
MRAIADKCGSMLMCDMAHISGLLLHRSQQPFEYCDVVTTTTHKSLRGPRAGEGQCCGYGDALMEKGYKLVTDGNKVEKVCELAHITLNKNAVFGDSSALSPGGVRVDSKGAWQAAERLQQRSGEYKDIADLKVDVEKFASSFDMPGFDVNSLKYGNE